MIAEVPDDDLSPIDCGCCGLEIHGKDPRVGWYSDSEAIFCTECGAVNHVSVDEDGDGAYVSGWTCKHGRDDEVPCKECD